MDENYYGGKGGIQVKLGEEELSSRRPLMSQVEPGGELF